MSARGTPQRPNPPTQSDDPSDTSETANAIESNTLFNGSFPLLRTSIEVLPQAQPQITANRANSGSCAIKSNCPNVQTQNLVEILLPIIFGNKR